MLQAELWHRSRFGRRNGRCNAVKSQQSQDPVTRKFAGFSPLRPTHSLFGLNVAGIFFPKLSKQQIARGQTVSLAECSVRFTENASIEAEMVECEVAGAFSAMLKALAQTTLKGNRKTVSAEDYGETHNRKYLETLPIHG